MSTSRRSPPPPPPPRNYRDAGTGQYVPKDYADRHKGTTVSEPRETPSKKK